MFFQSTLKQLTYTFLIVVFSGHWSATLPNDDINETIGSLSARIEDLENQISSNGRSEDRNPGARVSADDLDQLKDEIRALRDRRQTSSEDFSRLQEEIRHLREDMSQLQKENADLRRDFSKKSRTSPSSFQRDHSPASTLEDEAESEVESVLRLLEQSAPSQDQGHKGPSTKKINKAGLETVREMATKEAEEKAPSLPVGDAGAQYNEAFSLYNKKAYKEAERAFDYFLKTYPNHPLASKSLYWKGESCAKQGKYKEAKILFVTAYKKDRKSQKAPHCLLRLGEILALQDRKEDACTAWVKLKTDFPHMTKEMTEELAALKKKYGCGKNPETGSKPSAQS